MGSSGFCVKKFIKSLLDFCRVDGAKKYRPNKIQLQPKKKGNDATKMPPEITPHTRPMPSQNPALLRLALIVGHTSGAPGAYSKYLKTHEYNYNSDLALEIQLQALKRQLFVSVFYRDQHGLEGAFKEALKINPTAIMELHFNAFNGKARGTEILFSAQYDLPGLKELALAHNLALNISSALNLPNRGVKEIAKSGERGFWNLSRTTSTPSVLLEPGFGDNKHDARALKNNKTLLAKTIINSFMSWDLRLEHP